MQPFAGNSTVHATVRRIVVAAALVGLIATQLAANDQQAAATAILESRCLNCHNQTQRKGGLSLASRSDALAGGDSGPSLVVGQPRASLMLESVTGTKPAMPKSGPPLTAAEVQALTQWIELGAAWPQAGELRDRSLPTGDWWSLQPLVRPAVSSSPPREGAPWVVRNPIDAFVVAGLHDHGLLQSAEADRRTLIRRLSFDLVGLPPTSAETEAFLADTSPLALENLVDRLLASPRYGETWARHWLDIVHYGETHGYDKDKPRPHAWPFRDYVIRSFNNDKPYGRFVEEQVAGDVLYPESADGHVALGFIAAGPWDFIGHAELPESKIDGQIARHLDRDDMVQNTLGTFCSLTVGCAQCHDHKFDPIPQIDYYRLQAVFSALDRIDKPYDPDPTIHRRRQELLAKIRRIEAEQTALEAELDRRGGGEWNRLNNRLAELAAAKATRPRPEYGYHSALANQPDTIKWVQLDLGSPHMLGRIEFVGCYDDFNKIGAGFGFPQRYKIEVSDDPHFAAGVRIVVDRTAADVPNPGVEPQSIELSGCLGRYVRFTATRLAARLPTDFNFALAEFAIYSVDGQNLAPSAKVSALDSIESPPRWRRTNLVDGIFYEPHAANQAEIKALRQSMDELRLRLLPAEELNRIDELAAQLRDSNGELAALPKPQLAYIGAAHQGKGNFSGSGGVPRTIRVLPRGDVTQRGAAVGPGALSCVPELAASFDLPAGHSEAQRRAALAHWLSSARHPLTWRSIANRLWHYHFGRGIVETPNDFGRMGAMPTHPELLDWLATELRDGNQSLKHMHRLIVTSHTYRQQSNARLDAHPTSSNPTSIDADNRYLWRANRRRISAEALRDAILAVAGRLDLSMGGPSFQDFVIEQPAHSPHYEYGLHDPDDSRAHRRSIYRFIVRSQPQPFLATFDCADPSQRVDKRTESHSALQALALLNNGLLAVMSTHFAEQVERAQATPEEQAAALFRIALSREPAARERQLFTEFIRAHGLANACRTIFNLNEFVFID